jgi:hypothetical protein
MFHAEKVDWDDRGEAALCGLPACGVCPVAVDRCDRSDAYFCCAPGFLAASLAFSLASGLPASRVSISVVSFPRMSGL